MDPGDFRTLPEPGTARPSSALASTQKTQSETCLLPPLDLIRASIVSASQLRVAGEAKREYQQACWALAKKKTADAEKHLRRAVEKDEKYSAAWVTLGQLFALQKRADNARSACSQGSTADPSYVPAYLCLADLAARGREWGEALKWSRRALELDPNDVVGYEFNALANANLNDLDEAEKSGLRAAEIDKNHREPRIHFVLAQIYEARNDSVHAAQQLREYMAYSKSPEQVARVKQMLSKLENASLKATEEYHPANAAPAPTPSPMARLGPPDIDDFVPPVLDETNCPLPRILKEMSSHTQDLIENLQRFSARESIEQTVIDKHGKRGDPARQVVNYVAEVEEKSSAYPVIREYRSGESTMRQSPMVDSGTAAFGLIFHPTRLANLTFRCEGLTLLQGSSAWQLRFEESADPDKAFTAMRVGDFVYQPRLKGRAWVATSGYVSLRIETDLVAPIPQIDFQREHLIISYAPVDFPGHHLRLWLPETASVYIAYRAHRYERVHNFGEFQLFSVESTEAVKEPPGQQK